MTTPHAREGIPHLKDDDGIPHRETITPHARAAAEYILSTVNDVAAMPVDEARALEVYQEDMQKMFDAATAELREEVVARCDQLLSQIEAVRADAVDVKRSRDEWMEIAKNCQTHIADWKFATGCQTPNDFVSLHSRLAAAEQVVEAERLKSNSLAELEAENIALKSENAQLSDYIEELTNDYKRIVAKLPYGEMIYEDRYLNREEADQLAKIMASGAAKLKIQPKILPLREQLTNPAEDR